MTAAIHSNNGTPKEIHMADSDKQICSDGPLTPRLEERQTTVTSSYLNRTTPGVYITESTPSKPTNEQEPMSEITNTAAISAE